METETAKEGDFLKNHIMPQYLLGKTFTESLEKYFPVEVCVFTEGTFRVKEKLPPEDKSLQYFFRDLQ